MIIDGLGVKPYEAMMMAAQVRDLAGAKNVGFQTAFFGRPGTSAYPNVAKPHHVVNDLPELVKLLQEADSIEENR